MDYTESDSDTASHLSISLDSAPSSPTKASLPLSPPVPARSPSPLHRHSFLLDDIPETPSLDKSLKTPTVGGTPSMLSPPGSAIDLKTPTKPSAPPSSATNKATYTGKGRPESILLTKANEPLILGIALVDFNHLVGPRIEWSEGKIFEDEEIANMLPFLALPDGVHLSVEDYSYFHLVPSSPNPQTLFGIACTRQVKTADLLYAEAHATRSTVQKAVVLVSSKPIFSLVRDKLGVVTRALFEQRDFRETDMLKDFSASLEVSLHSQLTESGLYMGTSLRELVHKFRNRTLVLLKALMLQKRIMFFGHPVERLCTYQYSVASLIPGLLFTLEDCGSPPLAQRAPTLSRPTSLKTSDRQSMLAYLGLPLDVFGKDAMFQPYLPLQGLDMLKSTPSWLVGSTNDIVVAAKDVQLSVNTDTGVFEFRDPRLERMAALTAADRRWMDELVRDVNEGWNDEDPTRTPNLQYKGSDDYLRTKFEEYISSALASIRYRDFIKKGEGSGVGIVGGEANSLDDFNQLWVAEFRTTNAYTVWERVTDPMIFDIVEPRHPCNEKVSVMGDIGLRLSEGIQDLHLEQQLAPTREAISKTISVGSTNLFKAFEGVRGWTQARMPPALPLTSSNETAESIKSPTVPSPTASVASRKESIASVTSVTSQSSTSSQQAPRSALTSSWSSGIGSYFNRARLSTSNTGSPSASGGTTPADHSPAKLVTQLPKQEGQVDSPLQAPPTPSTMFSLNRMFSSSKASRPESLASSRTSSSDNASELRMQIKDLEGDRGTIDLSELGIDPTEVETSQTITSGGGLASLAAEAALLPLHGSEAEHDIPDDAKTPRADAHPSS